MAWSSALSGSRTGSALAVLAIAGGKLAAAPVRCAEGRATGREARLSGGSVSIMIGCDEWWCAAEERAYLQQAFGMTPYMVSYRQNARPPRAQAGRACSEH